MGQTRREEERRSFEGRRLFLSSSCLGEKSVVPTSFLSLLSSTSFSLHDFCLISSFSCSLVDLLLFKFFSCRSICLSIYLEISLIHISERKKKKLRCACREKRRGGSRGGYFPLRIKLPAELSTWCTYTSIRRTKELFLSLSWSNTGKQINSTSHDYYYYIMRSIYI